MSPDEIIEEPVIEETTEEPEDDGLGSNSPTAVEKPTYDVKNLKEVTTMIAKLAHGVIQAREDGKWNFTDGIFFVEFLKAVPAAIGDIGMVDDEIRDLKEAEVDEIVAHVAGQLEIIEIEDSLRNWIVGCIGVAIKIVYLVQEGIEIL